VATKKETINWMRFAGYHDDSAAFTRLLIERGAVGYTAAMEAWSHGVRCKEQGMKCHCPKCNPKQPTYPPLTAYRVFYDDGSTSETNMAAGVTIDDAARHFVGHRFELTETTFRTAVRVERI